MKLAVRLLTLALCAFAWYENTLLVTPKPCEVKPSASVACHPGDVFMCTETNTFKPESRIWVETISIGGVGLPACPSNKKCV